MEVLPDDGAKLAWLLAALPAFVDEGEVLVFVNQRVKVRGECKVQGLGGGLMQFWVKALLKTKGRGVPVCSPGL